MWESHRTEIGTANIYFISIFFDYLSKSFRYHTISCKIFLFNVKIGDKKVFKTTTTLSNVIMSIWIIALLKWRTTINNDACYCFLFKPVLADTVHFDQIHIRPLKKTESESRIRYNAIAQKAAVLHSGDQNFLKFFSWLDEKLKYRTLNMLIRKKLLFLIGGTKHLKGPDPDPTKRSGSHQIRIPNTGLKLD
jgi:hypothetical protein